MADDFHAHTLGNLEEARRLPERLGVDVQRLIYSRRTLRGKLFGALGELAQVAHLLIAQKQIQVGPALSTSGRAHPDEPAARFQYIEPLGMLGCGDDDRSRAEILAKVK